MRILYGVAAEGMGHAVRSAVVARHLQDRGHGVCIASSGKALEYMQARFASTIRVTGLGIVQERGQLSHLSTVISNAVRQGLGALGDLATGLDVALSDRPDVVISDFEPWSARLALALSVPLLAVDSLHFLSRFRHPRELIDVDAALTLPVIDAMVPFARRYFVCPLSSFSVTAPSTHPENTSVHLPILRPEILRAKKNASVGKHLTVYLNDLASSRAALEVLALSDVPCHVWGGPRPPGIVSSNLSFRPFDDAGFLYDLMTCRAVVGSAGALLGEAAAIGKPMLALPIGGHWEQKVNASYLEAQGYGESHDVLTSEGLSLFLERAPEYAKVLKSVQHDDNRELFEALDLELSRIAAL
jgi:uncharacterized protein (TIGR00661 family)